MGTIQQKLNKLKTTKADIKTALQEKGMSPSNVFSTYADEIRNIPTGGFTGHPDVDGLKAIGWTDDDIQDLQDNIWWNAEDDDKWLVEEETIEEYQTKKTLTSFNVITQKDNPIYFYAKFFPKITFTSVPVGFNRQQTYAFPSLIWTSTTKPSGTFTHNYLQNLRYIIMSKIYKDVDLSNVAKIAFSNNNDSVKYIDLRNIDLSGVTNFSALFSGCRSLEKIDGIENLITSSYTGSLGSVFTECRQLKELNISGWDVSNVTSLNGLFSYCINLKEMDLRGWDVSNVTDFVNCFTRVNLKTLNISGWDLSSATSMQGFLAYSSVDELYMNNINTSTITNMSNIFQGIAYIKKIYGADFDCSASTSNNNILTNQVMLQELYDSQGTQTSVLNGIHLSFSLNVSYGISHDSIVAILNGLASGVSGQTLTLGATNLNKLTAEEKAIATNKGWTLA